MEQITVLTCFQSFTNCFWNALKWSHSYAPDLNASALREAFELQAKDKATRRLKEPIQDTSPDLKEHTTECQ
jgi:hypothetical protein